MSTDPVPGSSEVTEQVYPKSWKLVLPIMLGTLTLLEAFMWTVDFPYFLSDLGPVPRWLVLQEFPASRMGLSVHMLSADPLWQLLLCLLHLFSGAWILRQPQRLQPRLLAWFLGHSASVRCPYLFGGILGWFHLALLVSCCLVLPLPSITQSGSRRLSWTLLASICLISGLARLQPSGNLAHETADFLGLNPTTLDWVVDESSIGSESTLADGTQRYWRVRRPWLRNWHLRQVASLRGLRASYADYLRRYSQLEWGQASKQIVLRNREHQVIFEWNQPP